MKFNGYRIKLVC